MNIMCELHLEATSDQLILPRVYFSADSSDIFTSREGHGGPNNGTCYCLGSNCWCSFHDWCLTYVGLRPSERPSSSRRRDEPFLSVSRKMSVQCSVVCFPSVD